MDDNELSESAISACLNYKQAYCKFLSANDSGESHSHQVGILISKSAKSMLFTDEEIMNNPLLKKPVHVTWQDHIDTDSVFTWYSSKNELRLTKFGRHFGLLKPEETGSLFVLVKKDPENSLAYIINTEEGIQNFLDAFGITPAETNRPIDMEKTQPSVKEKVAIDNFINGLEVEFPLTEQMSMEARILYYYMHPESKALVKSDPDKILLDWTDEEYKLFRSIEHARYGKIIEKGFSSVDDFIEVANKVLNRRKSRAGKSLEHHLAAIFDANSIQYTPQAVTEGNKKPDFVFPSSEAYHNASFDVNHLCTLAAKTTCKDRWRQILNEADRMKGRTKYLCTMQQGISSAQLNEMASENVVIVVPKAYISSYPREHQKDIWTISKFVNYVKEMEND